MNNEKKCIQTIFDFVLGTNKKSRYDLQIHVEINKKMFQTC